LLTPTPAEPPVPPPGSAGPVGRFLYMHLLCGMVTYHLEKAAASREASLFGVVCILTSDDIWRALMATELIELRYRRDAEGPP
jgi:hypothetical protein